MADGVPDRKLCCHRDLLGVVSDLDANMKCLILLFGPASGLKHMGMDMRDMLDELGLLELPLMVDSVALGGRLFDFDAEGYSGVGIWYHRGA